MDVRESLLKAAIAVYADAGVRGATTRRIAQQAGVNEVTLFRLFGSKSALIAEAIREHAPRATEPGGLPVEPVDPESELSAWCDAQLTHLRAARSMIRKAMGEIEEHPEMAPCMSEGTQYAFRELLDYVGRLRPAGGGIAENEIRAAAAMLISALFGDAMGREMMPMLYPQPESDAAALYSRNFLRAIGWDAPRRRSPARGAHARQRARGTATRR